MRGMPGSAERARQPRELVAACMDYIALEGATGASVAAVFAAVDVVNDQPLRREVWPLLRSQQTSRGVLHFFFDHMSSAADTQAPGAAGMPAVAGMKRKRPGSPCYDSDDQAVTVKRETSAATPDANTTVETSGIVQRAALNDSEVAAITYEAVENSGVDGSPLLKVVACEELRHRALNIPIRAIAADLGAEHLQILEAVGRARVQGMTVTALSTAFSGGSVKRLHNCLDTLLSYGLVVKRMMIVARPVMRRLNIIHLPRFALLFKPQMFDEGADFESDEQCKKILCAAVEKYLKQLPTHSSVLSDIGRDLNLQKRHLEVLRSHILQEAKKDEDFHLELFQAVLQPSRRANLEPKILNCVRYKPQDADARARKAAATAHSRRGIVLEQGLLHQIYSMIEDSAENGTTIVEMRNQIVLPGSKLPYKLVSVLAGTYGLKAESIILGKNKAFRLYVNSAAPSISTVGSTSISSPALTEAPANKTPQLRSQPQSGDGGQADDSSETVRDVKVEGNFSVRANKALRVALGGAEVDGTLDRRRNHIMERLGREKIISLSSLRASVFGMEKQLAGNSNNSSSTDVTSISGHPRSYTNSMSPASVGMVDTRSIFRIATDLEVTGKLRLLQLPLPARNVSTKFRALRCVVLPGYEQNDGFIQGFVKNYCRDERLRRIHQNVDKGQVVRFHSLESDENELEVESTPQGAARKRRRAGSTTSNLNSNGNGTVHNKTLENGTKTEAVGDAAAVRHAAGIDTGSSDAMSPPPHEISYRIRRFVSQTKSGIHNHQYRKLGFAYGVMYRCKVLHKFLWQILNENREELQLPGEKSTDLSINDLDADEEAVRTGDQPFALGKGIVFSRETVLHSMPVYLYIQVFSGGATLTAGEFGVVEEAIANKSLFDALPEPLREKIWSHESQRTAKVLGTLADLDLVSPHKIGMNNLIKILRAGYTDGRDGVLSRALKDNALGGLFRFNTQIRINLDDKSVDNERVFSPSDQHGTPRRRSINELETLRIVGFTEKTYSFSSVLPLRFTFQSVGDVDRYWEALECLCLEQMVMEVENPGRNEPAVCEVPKPVKTRARRMLRILAWIAKSRNPVAKHKRDDGTDGSDVKCSGIVSTTFRPRKRRRQLPDGNSNGISAPTALDGSKPETRSGLSKNKSRTTKMSGSTSSNTEEQAKTDDLTWTNEHEQLLIDYFVENCKSRWRVSIPQGLQRDNEQVAFRNHTVSRSGFGLVAIARKLGKRKIDVKKRLKEKLMEPSVKLLFEGAKREARLADNPGGIFDEEVAIRGSTRLTALFRRAVMMIVSPHEEYHPLVAEELISFWSAPEIRLVWRYLWLKNWIVRATEKERGRGYSMSQRLQDALKVTTLSYPLLLFQQAAEQESLVCSTLEEITPGRNSHDTGKPRAGPAADGIHHSDQLFEDVFPMNATPGQCALELGCQVLGTCSLTVSRTEVSDDTGTDAEIDEEEATKGTSGRGRSRRSNMRLLSYKNLKSGSGFAAHLAKQVDFTKPSMLIDTWRVETKMHAVTVENKNHLQSCEAFSTEDTDDNSGLGVIAFRPFRHRKEFEKSLGQEVVRHVRESGESGLTLPMLMEKLREEPCDQLQATSLVRVGRCLNTLVDEGSLLCVNAYFDQRFIVKDHGDVWLLRPFSLVPSAGSASTPQVVFEGEKDTLSFPWLKMDGGTNYKFLFAIQRKLLSLILQYPGITEERTYAKMGKLLTLQDTREAMSLLVEEGLVYARAVTSSSGTEDKKTPVSLFGSRSMQPSSPRVVKLVGNVLAYDRSLFVVHYFPHVECIQRFGSIVQDYQNEVTEFQRD